MTPEAQQIAIAEATFFKRVVDAYVNPAWKDIRNPQSCVLYTLSIGGFCLPNYPGDLNEMREAEKVIMAKGKWYKYCDELYYRFKGEGDCHTFMHATAAQRARAFLETLGLWDNGSD